MAVLSNVLQNGDPRWTAATDIAQLIEPPPGKLRDYTPQIRYCCSTKARSTKTRRWR